MIKTINIGRDFARDLGPRYVKLGPHSGEEFRDDVLIPAFNESEALVVTLDDVDGFSASFLEEAFGGIVREFGYERVTSKLKIESVYNSAWVLMIQAWMRDAENDYKNKTPNIRTR